MRICYKGRFLSSEQIWFEGFDTYESVRALRTKADNIFVCANPVPLEGKYMSCHEQESLISCLNADMDEIMQKFSSTTRNEIRRAEREGVQICFYSSDDVNQNDDVLKRMAVLYTNMYAEKGMPGIELPIGELRAYAKSGHLLISVALIDGSEVVFHSYIVCENKSRLLHSCSEFRVADNAARNAIGRANKYLHFKDMERLSSIGVDHYDWGGISSSCEPNGIDKFKMSFGGELAKYYNIKYVRSFKQRLLERVLRSFHRGKKNV